jgi:hypothetical protein
MKQISTFAKVLWQDTSGVILPYTTLLIVVIVVIVGVSVLALDPRYSPYRGEAPALADMLGGHRYSSSACRRMGPGFR